MVAERSFPQSPQKVPRLVAIKPYGEAEEEGESAFCCTGLNAEGMLLHPVCM